MTIAKLGGRFDLNRDAGQVLDQVLAHHSGVQGAAGAHDDDTLVVKQVAITEIELRKTHLSVVEERAPDDVANGLAVLMDLLEHEMRKTSLLRLADVPGNAHHFGLDGRSFEVGHDRAELADGNHLPLAQDQRLAGVGEDARDVGAVEPLLLAQAYD